MTNNCTQDYQDYLREQEESAGEHFPGTVCDRDRKPCSTSCVMWRPDRTGHDGDMQGYSGDLRGYCLRAAVLSRRLKLSMQPKRTAPRGGSK